ncbi:MAG: YtxH domain-containing protein [Bryobacterales bacterium]|nr:YtxH domain-containing protein [Bryobacteraceae bacterium]MDW8353677.1 YtxH domain-containing protein [Bryobacterales bacterium]
MSEEKGLSYFFLGLGIGVAIGVLFAPKSGEETRDYLRSKAGEGRDYLKRRGEELYESAGDLVEKGKAAITSQKERLAAAVEAGKQAYREAVAGETGSRAEA